MKGLVYIVDDDPQLRQSLAGLLGDEGFEVTECINAEHFLDIESIREPSCILLDVEMDGMSGFELQKQLSKREFSPPIIFLSGNANLKQIADSMRLGAYHFLMKPVDDNQLLEAVKGAIASILK